MENEIRYQVRKENIHFYTKRKNMKLAELLNQEGKLGESCYCYSSAPVGKLTYPTAEEAIAAANAETHSTTYEPKRNYICVSAEISVVKKVRIDEKGYLNPIETVTLIGEEYHFKKQIGKEKEIKNGDEN